MKSIVSRIRGRDLYTRRRQTPKMEPRDCYAIVYTSGDWQFLLGRHVLRAVRGCRDDDVWGWWKGRAQAVRLDVGVAGALRNSGPRRAPTTP
jgi:hypothetical protein